MLRGRHPDPNQRRERRGLPRRCRLPAGQPPFSDQRTTDRGCQIAHAAFGGIPATRGSERGHRSPGVLHHQRLHRPLQLGDERRRGGLRGPDAERRTQPPSGRTLDGGLVTAGSGTTVTPGEPADAEHGDTIVVVGGPTAYQADRQPVAVLGAPGDGTRVGPHPRRAGVRSRAPARGPAGRTPRGCRSYQQPSVHAALPQGDRRDPGSCGRADACRGRAPESRGRARTHRSRCPGRGVRRRGADAGRAPRWPTGARRPPSRVRPTARGCCKPGQVVAAVARVQGGGAPLVERIHECMGGGICRRGAHAGTGSATQDAAPQVGEG